MRDTPKNNSNLKKTRAEAIKKTNVLKLQSTFAQDEEGKNINMKLCRTQNKIAMIKIILLAYLSLLEKFFDLYVSQFDIM